MPPRPTLAVWKFASCDGCQLSVLDLEDELLDLAAAVDIAYFKECHQHRKPGRYDLSLVEGSVTTSHDAARIREVRRQSKTLVTIGACATAGGIQALRNFADVKEYLSIVYASPAYISTLATSTAIADHVAVDFELRGCPVNKHQLLDVITAFLHGRKPNVAGHSVCVECKIAGNVCVMVTGTPCLGPVTHAGCGALCPTYQRGCYGCYGPMEAPNAVGSRRRSSVRARVAAACCGCIGPSTHPHPRSRKRARDMTTEDQNERGHQDDPRRLPRPRRGRGCAHDPARRGPRHRGAARDLRATAILRSAAPRARLRRGARHHRANLRDLSGRVHDERVPRDGRCPRPGAAAAAPDATAAPLRGEWIESHGLHVFLLHAPDFLGYPDAVTMARDHRGWVQKGLRLKKAGNAIMTLLGGREIHPINVRVAASIAHRPAASSRRSCPSFARRATTPARRCAG